MKFNSEQLIRDITEKRLVQNKMTLRKAAAEVGCSAATMSRAERGGHIDIDTLLLLCQWLGTTPNDYVTQIKTDKNQNPKWKPGMIQP